MEKKCKVVLKKPKHGRAYYNNKELKIGTKIELEHTKSPHVARNIAMNHLDEFPDYYKNLRTMEMRMKKKMMKKRK
jgi:hypothetical protein